MIEVCLLKINKVLKQYIENTIFPLYKENDLAHDIDHVLYVIDRSLKIASREGVNLDMAYTIASYHDCGHHIDAQNHELVSANILVNDKNLNKWFSKEQIEIMKQAVEDHRAILGGEPRSIYGKIVSSADRNTSVDSILIRTFEYRKKHSPHLSYDQVIEESKNHIIDKFGNNGYAVEKNYFKDDEYSTFLKEINELVRDDEKFIIRYKKANKID